MDSSPARGKKGVLDQPLIVQAIDQTIFWCKQLPALGKNPPSAGTEGSFARVQRETMILGISIPILRLSYLGLLSAHPAEYCL